MIFTKKLVKKIENANECPKFIIFNESGTKFTKEWQQLLKYLESYSKMNEKEKLQFEQEMQYLLQDLRKYIDLNSTQNEFNKTVLQLAIDSECQSVINSIVLSAAMYGDEAVLDWFLKNEHIDIKTLTECDGENKVLHMLLFNQHFDILEKYLEQKYLFVDDFHNDKFEDGCNLIHLIAKHPNFSDEEAVEILNWMEKHNLVTKDMFTAKNKFGCTPIMLAGANANFGALKCLAEKIGVKKEDIVSSGKSIYGCTMLHLLAYNPDISAKKVEKFLDEMLKNGFLAAKDAEELSNLEMTPWMVAGEQGKTEMFMWFYNNKFMTKENIQQQKSGGNLKLTVLQLAKNNGHCDFLFKITKKVLGGNNFSFVQLYGEGNSPSFGFHINNNFNDNKPGDDINLDNFDIININNNNNIKDHDEEKQDSPRSN